MIMTHSLIAGRTNLHNRLYFVDFIYYPTTKEIQLKLVMKI